MHVILAHWRSNWITNVSLKLDPLDWHHPADKMIQDALADGALDATVHKGKPLPAMRENNPGWWIASFLEREKLPERLRALTEEANEMLRKAVEADTLAEARLILADRNRGVLEWNAAVSAEHHLAVVEETDLLTLRQQRFA
jgi:DnaJ homologue, subfamily C, member 28, conserved domain